MANPKYTSIFKHISVDILGPLFIRSNNNSRVKIWLLFIIDVVFYAVDFFILDNISSESIKIALKTLESKFGRIIYFSSDSGSQLRETLINPTDNKGTPIFSWKSSSRCGPQSQKHNLIESRVSTVKKFAHKIFKNKICKSRQLTELILTIA